jgi:hypothetical protein
MCVRGGRRPDPLAAHVPAKDPALTGSDSVKNKRPVFADKGGDRWHLWDCREFSCKSQSGAINQRRRS